LHASPHAQLSPHPQEVLAQTLEAMKGESAMKVKNAARARFSLVSNLVMGRFLSMERLVWAELLDL